MHGLEAAPRAATSAIAGFHIFPFGGLRKARNWLRDFPANAPELARASSSPLHPNP
jgi:methylenetetrahydrofolate reductase (NADPH)